MTAGKALVPYVPRLVVDWLQHTPEATHQALPCTLVFADISGFTNLTETLAQRGKIGAEEMGDILNDVFEELLTAAYSYGAGLVKWGGDAVLLHFDGDDHAARACRASVEMQRVIRTVGRLATSCGAVRLRMSIGVHTGEASFFLVGSRHRELIVAGRAATEVALAEKTADAGEIVVTQDTVAALAAAGITGVGPPKEPGVLLEHRLPSVGPTGIRPAKRIDGIDVGSALPAALRDHLSSGTVDSEHRHVTVGFIEFSGADDLEARDPEALAAAIAELIDLCQSAAADNDVTILSTDVNPDGGKVILISGAPRRVGDDEIRVLTAVRRVLDGGGGALSLRAGVNSGRVFAGNFGPAYRRNYSVAGDCVNLAARLMGSAGPGELLTTREVINRSGEGFRFVDVPPFMVKGKSEPIHAVRVDGVEREHRRRTERSMPLVGREVELGELRRALGDAKRGVGRAIDLVGPAGIGKSRLLEELTDDSDALVVWVDGEVYGSAAPYQPIQRVLGDLLGLSPTAERPAVAAALGELVTEQAPDLVPWMPLIGLVVGLEFPMTPVVQEIDPAARKERMEWAISTLLGATMTSPTIMVFNDAHMMDDATLDLVDRLIRDGQDRPWLIVVTRRPGGPLPDPDPPHRVRLELEPLDSSATDALLAALSDIAPVPARHLALVAERAGGNPLFLLELAAGVFESDSLAELPDSIEGIVAARIDRLSAEQRRLLRSAAVVGMTMDVALLEVVLRLDGAVTPEAARELGALSEFLEQPEPGQLRFRHHLVREAAYEGLPYRRRMALHAAAADAIEQTGDPDAQADLLSMHYLHGGRHDGAWTYSRRAAEQALARYANADATECYRRALTAAEHLADLSPGELLRVLEALGDAHFELGEFEQAERALRRAHRLPDLEPEAVAQLSLKIARCRAHTGTHSVALRWLTKGRAVLGGARSERAALIEGSLSVNYARIRCYQGRYRDAMRWAREALEVAERCGDATTKALALEYLGVAELALGRREGAAKAAEALAMYEAAGDLGGQGRAHNNLGTLYFYQGDWPAALDHYRRAAAALDRAGNVWLAEVARANVAEVLSDQGHLDMARDMLESSIRVFRGLRFENNVAFAGYLLGRIDTRAGRYDDAMQRFDAARSFCAPAGEQGEVRTIDSLIAECHAAAGRHDEALALCDELLVSTSSVSGMDPTIPLLHRVRAHALHQAGRRDDAVDALHDSLRAARARGALHEVALSLDGLLDLDGRGDQTEVEGWRRERDELWEMLGILPGVGWR